MIIANIITIIIIIIIIANVYFGAWEEKKMEGEE